MSVLKIARKYYPWLWDEGRILALVEAGRLGEAEAQKIAEGANSDTK